MFGKKRAEKEIEAETLGFILDELRVSKFKSVELFVKNPEFIAIYEKHFYYPPKEYKIYEIQHGKFGPKDATKTINAINTFIKIYSEYFGLPEEMFWARDLNEFKAKRDIWLKQLKGNEEKSIADKLKDLQQSKRQLSSWIVWIIATVLIISILFGCGYWWLNKKDPDLLNGYSQTDVDNVLVKMAVSMKSDGGYYFSPENGNWSISLKDTNVVLVSFINRNYNNIPVLLSLHYKNDIDETPIVVTGDTITLINLQQSKKELANNILNYIRNTMDEISTYCDSFADDPIICDGINVCDEIKNNPGMIEVDYLLNTMHGSGNNDISDKLSPLGNLQRAKAYFEMVGFFDILAECSIDRETAEKHILQFYNNKLGNRPVLRAISAGWTTWGSSMNTDNLIDDSTGWFKPQIALMIPTGTSAVCFKSIYNCLLWSSINYSYSLEEDTIMTRRIKSREFM